MSKLQLFSMGLATASVAALAVYAIVLVTATGPGDSETGPVASETAIQRTNAHGRRKSVGGVPQPSWSFRARSEDTTAEDAASEYDQQPASEEPSVEDLRARANKLAIERENAFVEQFHAEPTDRRFSEVWEPRLNILAEKQMGSLEGLQRFDLECRSERCLGKVTWDSYGAAVASLDRAGEMAGGECATSVYMPEPDDLSATYTHRVRFRNCTIFEG